MRERHGDTSLHSRKESTYIEQDGGGRAVCTTWVTRRALHTHTHTFSRLAVGYVHCGYYLSSSGRSRSEEGGIIRERV